MAANMILKLSKFQRFSILKLNYDSVKMYCTDNSKKVENKEKAVGFAAALSKQLDEVNKSLSCTNEETFASLLRHSKFINLGKFEEKEVIGTIYQVVNNDLYIDFGWKFPAVCSKPGRNSSLYVRGAKVRLLIKDLELSTRFLGSTTDMTLLEADCVLLGIIKSPVKQQKGKAS